MRFAFFARIGRMGHAGRMLDQRFGIPQADGAADQCKPVHHRDTSAIAAFQLKRDHAAKARHLALGQVVLFERGEARIVDPRNARMSIQHLRHLHRVLSMALHPQFQRLQSAQDQHGIEGREHGAGHVFDTDHANFGHVFC